MGLGLELGFARPESTSPEAEVTWTLATSAPEKLMTVQLVRVRVRAGVGAGARARG